MHHHSIDLHAEAVLTLRKKLFDNVEPGLCAVKHGQVTGPWDDLKLDIDTFLAEIVCDTLEDARERAVSLASDGAAPMRTVRTTDDRMAFSMMRP